MLPVPAPRWFGAQRLMRSFATLPLEWTNVRTLFGATLTPARTRWWIAPLWTHPCTKLALTANEPAGVTKPTEWRICRPAFSTTVFLTGSGLPPPMEQLLRLLATHTTPLSTRTPNLLQETVWR